MDTDRMLRELRVAKPCPASWAEMSGDERTRFCSQCRRTVYNFSNLTRDEIAQLLSRDGQRVCGRYYRRADGMIMTADCPNPLTPAASKRIPLLALGVLLFTVVGAALTRAEPNEEDRLNPVVEQARGWPIVGELIDKLMPQRHIMGEMPMPVSPKSSSP